MKTAILFIPLILIKSDIGNQQNHDTCDYDCSYNTIGKPCKSLDTTNKICIDYDYNNVCKYGYKDCSNYNDPCNKECSNEYINYPCISIYKNDKTCYNYIQGYGCPDGSKDCTGLHKPCEYCTFNKPCISDNYINGDITCKEPIYNYFSGEYSCPDGTSLCKIGNNPVHDVCDKECSYETKGKPCIHLNYGDNTCFDYMRYGGCPAGTKDCSGIKDKCVYCDAYKPCLHDNKGDYSCLDTDKDGKCFPGSSLCVYPEPPKDYEICNKKCSEYTFGKPCQSTKYGDYNCVNYINYNECPVGYKDCSYVNDPYVPPKDYKVCHKSCSDKTKGLPCMHNNYGDNTCFDYMKYGGCPAGTTDCTNTDPCEHCNYEYPCLHENKGDNSCVKLGSDGKCVPGSTLCPNINIKYTNGYGGDQVEGKIDYGAPKDCSAVTCPVGVLCKDGVCQDPCSTTKCGLGKGCVNDFDSYGNVVANCCGSRNEEYKECGTACPKTCDNQGPIICGAVCVEGCFCKEGFIREFEKGECINPNYCEKPTDVCDKKCSYETKGKPCMHNNYGDDTCFDYMEYGGCPAGTTDCTGTDPCEHCDYIHPCLHDNKGDNSCLKLNPETGKCNPGSSLCPNKYQPYKPAKTEEICDKKCSDYTFAKPCVSKTYGDYDCVDYKQYGGCPDGYKDCSEVKDPCVYCDAYRPCLFDNYGEYSCKALNTYGKCDKPGQLCVYKPPKDYKVCDKKCSYETKGKPCMHNNYGDDTCFDYMKYGGCPAGTTDCTGTDPCENCNYEYPCLHDNKGDNSCLKLGKDGKCVPGSTLCPNINIKYGNVYGADPYKGKVDEKPEYKPPKDYNVCDKKCSYETKGKPCIHNNFGDDTCFDYMKYGGCPAGTTDCTGTDPCEHCDYIHPCLHDNYGDNSCLKLNPETGKCNPGSTLCPNKYSPYKPPKKEEICDKRCSDYTFGKPCVSTKYGDYDCVDYLKYGGCPDDYKDCNEVKDPCVYCDAYKPCLFNDYGKYSCGGLNNYGKCNEGSKLCVYPYPKPKDYKVCDKKCSYLTKGKPCMHNNYGDDTCFDYMTYGGCPAGTTDCTGTDPCEHCDYIHPCLHDNKGDNSCLKLGKDGKCVPGSTLCPNINIEYNNYGGDDEYKGKIDNKIPVYKVCDKKCSYNTKGKPCMHNNTDDNTCFDYMEYGGCPAGTTDCTGTDPCEHCNYEYPCLHDNKGDNSCLKLGKDGKCVPGSTLCYKYKDSYYAKINNELNTIENNSLNSKEIISLSIIMSTIIYIVGSICIITILYGLYYFGCCLNRNTNSKQVIFKALDTIDPEEAHEILQ